MKGMTRRRTLRGNSLITILFLSMVLIGLAVYALLISKSSAIFAGRSWAQDYGKRLADSALFAAVSELKAGNLSAGNTADGNPGKDIRYQPFPDNPEVYATLTFNPDGGEPYSTNNLVSSTKKVGWNGQAVPPKFCHLVAVAHYNGYVIVRQALIKDPPFPYSLASAGRIEGEQMEIFGLAEGEYSKLKPGEELAVGPEDKVPSGLISNFSASGESIVLGSGTTVSGDVRATGLIDIGPAVVQGVVRPNSAEQNLPVINIDELNPAGKPYAYKWNTGLSDVTGRARHDGNLTVGDLKLSEGLLFVDGDLTVTGTITGKGVLVATGKITVTGSMDTQADNAALVARGDIKVTGDGPASSRFQGLVYSEGSIELKKTTIMGAAVSKDATGVTKLEDVKVVNVPELASTHLEMDVTLEEAKKSTLAAYKGSGDPIGIREADGTFTPLSPNGDTEALQALGAKLAGTAPGASTWQFGAMEASGFNPTPSWAASDFINSANKWKDYLAEHASNNVTRDVVDLNMNTLISVDQRLQMMLHNTVPYSDD